MFRKAQGLHYIEFLTALHRQALFDWYLEIGCRKGESFSPARGRTIAVDPFFQITTNAIGAKPELHLFQTTSDAFFAGGFLARNGIRLSLSFIDGMHLIEYVLRDFLNAEAHSAPGGLIALHDACPWNLDMARRDFRNRKQNAWTGDVWKLVPILREYRPELQITMLDCAPTGLMLVGNLQPGNRVLSQKMPEILARYQEIGLDRFGVAAFNASFAYASAQAEAEAGFPRFAACRLADPAAPAPRFVSP